MTEVYGVYDYSLKENDLIAVCSDPELARKLTEDLNLADIRGDYYYDIVENVDKDGIPKFVREHTKRKS